MIDNYEHYITRNIVAFYKKRLLAPICYILLLTILFFVFPLGDMFSPTKMSKEDALIDAYAQGKEYITVTFEELTFTDNTATIILQEKKHAHLIEDFLGVIKSNNLVKGCVVKRDLAVLTVVGYAVDKASSFLPTLFSTLSKIGAVPVAINKIAGEAKISVYLDKNIAEEAVKRLNSVLFKPLT